MVLNLTLTKKGNRCSRIDTILTCPRLPPFTISISFATGGMYLYSSPTCTSISGLFRAAWTTLSKNINKLDHSQILIRRTNSTNLMKYSNYIYFVSKNNIHYKSVHWETGLCHHHCHEARQYVYKSVQKDDRLFRQW